MNKEKYREGTSTDEMGRGDLCQLEELAVSERKVSDHRDLVSRWLLALRAGERLYLYKLKFHNCHEYITGILVKFTCGMSGSNIL